MKIYWKSKAKSVDGWAHLWAKTVTAMNPTDHCINCLVGQRLTGFSPKMEMNVPLNLILPEKHEIVYFCGVSSSFAMDLNFHLPVRAASGKMATKTSYTGDELIVLNAEEIEFDDYWANRLFPEKSHKFLRCRNFQFAAQEFQEQLQRSRR